MNREIVLLLRKKKFRLLTRWKQRLEETFPLAEDDTDRPPPQLLFRSFEECLRLLRQEENEPSRLLPPVALVSPTEWNPRKRDWQILQIYMTGEEVLGEFLTSHAPWHKKLEVDERLQCLNLLYRVWHTLALWQMVACHTRGVSKKK